MYAGGDCLFQAMMELSDTADIETCLEKHVTEVCSRWEDVLGVFVGIDGNAIKDKDNFVDYWMAPRSEEDTLRSLAVLYVCLNWQKFQNFAVQPDGSPFGSAKMYANNMGKN